MAIPVIMPRSVLIHNYTVMYMYSRWVQNISTYLMPVLTRFACVLIHHFIVILVLVPLNMIDMIVAVYPDLRLLLRSHLQRQEEEEEGARGRGRKVPGRWTNPQTSQNQLFL